MAETESRPLVLINGLPASGKTSLGRALSHWLGWPLISKDALKDFLAGLWPAEPDPAWLSDAANIALWGLLRGVKHGAIVETWFGPTGIDAVRRGLQDAGYLEVDVVQLWCDVDRVEAQRRFAERALGSNGRHARHNAAGMTDGFWDTVTGARPLDLGHLIEVQTATPISDADLEQLAIAIRRALNRHG